MPGKNRAVFLDRDGTIVEDPGYLSRPEQLKLIDGAAEAIAGLRQAGFLVILATNQSAIARGLMTEDDLAAVHARLAELLAAADADAKLDAIYYCPFHPDAKVSAYKQESYLRKPRPGMLFKAAREHQLDLGSCWMVGDSERDVQAGKTAGCRAIRLDGDPETETMADKVLASLSEAAELILASPGRTPLRPSRHGEALVEIGQSAEGDNPPPADTAAQSAAAGPISSPALPSAAPPPLYPSPATGEGQVAGDTVVSPSVAQSTGKPSEPVPAPAPPEEPAQPEPEQASPEEPAQQPDEKPPLRTKERLLREIEQERQRAAAIAAGAASDADDAPEQVASKPSARPLDAGNMRHVLAEILQQLRQLNRAPDKQQWSTTKILGGLFQMLSWGLLGAAMMTLFNEGPGLRSVIWALAGIFMQLSSLFFFTMFKAE